MPHASDAQDMHLSLQAWYLLGDVSYTCISYMRHAVCHVRHAVDMYLMCVMRCHRHMCHAVCHVRHAVCYVCHAVS